MVSTDLTVLAFESRPSGKLSRPTSSPQQEYTWRVRPRRSTSSLTVQRRVSAWAWNLLQKTILIKRTSDFYSHRKKNSSVGPSFYCNYAEAERTRIWTFCSLYLILATIRLWQGLPDCLGAQETKAAWARLLQPCAWGPDLSRLDFPVFMGEFYNRARCRWQYPLFSLLWST